MDEKPRQTPAERASRARESAEDAAVRARRMQASHEFDEATQALRFAKLPNERLERIMHDDTLTNFERVMAWAVRYSLGEYSLFAIGEDGWPRLQAHCVREIGMDKALVSKAVTFGQMRGYLHPHPKELRPVLQPKLRELPDDPTTGEYKTFAAAFDAAHSVEYEQYAVARKMVKRYNYSRLAAFRQAQRAAGEQPIETAADVPLTPLEQNQRRHQARQKQRRMQSAAEILDPGGIPAEGWTREECLAYLVTQIRYMQESAKDTPFARPAFTGEEAGDRAFLDQLLLHLGCWDQEYVVGWIPADVVGKVKGLSGKGAQPRPIGSEKGIKGIGLLLNWADDYARLVLKSYLGDRTRGAGA